jgi:hypothetical protein
MHLTGPPGLLDNGAAIRPVFRETPLGPNYAGLHRDNPKPNVRRNSRQMIRSRGKIGMDISTNRQIRKMRFSIFGGEDHVEKKTSK